MNSAKEKTVFLSLICLTCFVQVLSCPTDCMCKWKGGKQTVECVSKGLITIPTGIDTGTQVLDLSGNNLQNLPRARYERMGLLNLQRIYLSKCKISQIDDRAFRGLSNLVELDLSENLLQTLPTETFVDFPSLMRLIVSGNPIRTLQSASFRTLSFLTSLELSNCQIDTIEDGTFVGLDNLEWLRLDGNRLNFIRGENILPDALHGVSLDRNPWQCDCRLLEVHNWLLNYKVPHSVEPKCAGPRRLIGEPIRNLEVSDLACLPDVSPTTLYLEIAEGKNISLLCRVSAIPEASVSWWFQGRVLQNDTMLAPGFHFYYFVEEGREEKRSELFIFNTNTDDNGTFVCAAENPAGKSLSNYTIRIIVKEEPVVGLIVFPFEYLVTICAAVAFLCLLTLLILAFLLIRCQKQRKKRRKKERNKVIALQNQGRKSGLRNSNQISASSVDSTKTNGTIVLSERQCQDLNIYIQDNGLPTQNDLQSIPSEAYGASPQSVYTADQNPDLINGTESVGNIVNHSENDTEVNSNYQASDGTKDNFVQVSSHQTVQVIPGQWQRDPRFVPTLPRNALVPGSRELNFLKQHHTADVHLSPGRFLDGDGYPVDYGLPKVPIVVPVAGDEQMSYYRTLPHKRHGKMSAAIPSQRYALEAEFLSQSVPYEHYEPPNVRYTVEGYPSNPPPIFSPNEYPEASFIPSPPAGYKTEIGPVPVIGVPVLPTSNSTGQWQNFQKQSLPPDVHPHRLVSQCSVAAQTNPICETSDKSPQSSKEQTGKPSYPAVQHPLRISQPVPTESPDEGYVGDATESTEI